MKNLISLNEKEVMATNGGAVNSSATGLNLASLLHIDHLLTVNIGFQNGNRSSNYTLSAGNNINAGLGADSERSSS